MSIEKAQNMKNLDLVEKILTYEIHFQEEEEETTTTNYYWSHDLCHEKYKIKAIF